ncbi:MAG: low specificity L-threonine aldolase [Polyangiaceae bacterium]|nr:low specificity L-threonine aldolase [Polyangiaceae bacterium]
MSFLDKHPPSERLSQFASDNTSGICPEALEAMTEANLGFSTPYGDDRWTQKASDALREVFETDCEIFFCFNGTAANGLALSQLCHSYQGVIAHPVSHIQNDECGAPAFYSQGLSLLLGTGKNGKLSVDAVDSICSNALPLHAPQPKAISLTQSTELGTCYTTNELGQLSEAAKRNQLAFHIDGARFSNACAALGRSPKNLTHDLGVDVLSLGGTKNGLGLGEAVVFFTKGLALGFEYRCKQAGQLASKMRYLTAPWVKMLQEDAWLKHARHANQMAQLLEERLSALPSFRLIRAREVNSVFYEIDRRVLEQLRKKGLVAHEFVEGGVRLMCSWQTTPDDIQLLVEEAQQATKA